MATDSNYRTPFMAVHPGSILHEELKERKIRQRDFAYTIGVAPTQIYAFIRGERGLGEGWAALFEQHLGVSATLWENLQTDYERDIVAIRQRDEHEGRRIGAWLKNMVNGGINALTPHQRAIFNRGIKRVARQLSIYTF